MQADRQTDRQTTQRHADRNTSHPYRGEATSGTTNRTNGAWALWRQSLSHSHPLGDQHWTAAHSLSPYHGRETVCRHPVVLRLHLSPLTIRPRRGNLQYRLRFCRLSRLSSELAICQTRRCRNCRLSSLPGADTWRTGRNTRVVYDSDP